MLFIKIAISYIFFVLYAYHNISLKNLIVILLICLIVDKDFIDEFKKFTTKLFCFLRINKLINKLGR